MVKIPQARPVFLSHAEYVVSCSYTDSNDSDGYNIQQHSTFNSIRLERVQHRKASFPDSAGGK